MHRCTQLLPQESYFRRNGIMDMFYPFDMTPDQVGTPKHETRNPKPETRITSNPQTLTPTPDPPRLCLHRAPSTVSQIDTHCHYKYGVKPARSWIATLYGGSVRGKRLGAMGWSLRVLVSTCKLKPISPNP
jgi:hypothetical protein